MALTVGLGGPISAQPKPQHVQLGKQASALVVLPGRGFGTAFCIDESGYYITCDHLVRRRGPGEHVTLVLHAGEADERLVQARVVRTDVDSDLALLKVDGAAGLAALRLGSTEKLFETAEVVAFGYPFGRALRASNEEHPSISVNVGRVTALRKSKGDLETIQFDAQVNPGNSGGPVVDGTGEVIGVVSRGVVGSGVNFAVPVERIKALLAEPLIAFDPPAVAFADRYAKLKMPVRVTRFDRSDGPLDVEIILKDRSTERRFNAEPQEEDGRYVIQAPAVAEPLGEPTMPVEVMFSGGSLRGRVGDLEAWIDGKAVRLSQLSRVERRDGGWLVVQKDGAQIDVDVFKPERLKIDVGQTEIPVDVAKAKRVLIYELPPPPREVGYTLRVLREGRALAETTGFILIAPPPLPAPQSAGTVNPAHWRLLIDDRGWRQFPLQEKADTTFEDGALTVHYAKGQAEQASLLYARHAFEDYFDLQVEWRGAGIAGIRPAAGGGTPVHVKTTSDDWHTLRLTRRDGRLLAVLDGRPAPLQPAGAAQDMANAVFFFQLKKDQRVSIKRFVLASHRDAAPPSPAEYQPPQAALGVASPITLKLPEPWRTFAVAGGGRYFLFHLSKAKKVVVFDVVEGKIVHQVEGVPEDVLIAGGLDKFVLVMPGQQMMHCWGMAPFEREKVVPLPITPVRTALLGANSRGPLLLAGEQSRLVDLESFKPMTIEGPVIAGSGNHGYRVDVSADGTTFAGIVLGFGPVAYNIMKIDGNRTTIRDFGSTSNAIRHARPSADGRLIFHPGHGMFDTATFEDATVKWHDGTTGHPTVDPRYFITTRFVEANERTLVEINVCTTADRRIVHRFQGLEQLQPQGHRNERTDIHYRMAHGEPRFHYLPWANAIVALHWGNEQVYITPFNLIEALEHTGQDYLFVDSLPPTRAYRGSPYRYQLQVLSKVGGVRFTLESGPEGMSISPEGELLWKVSPQFAADTAEVIVRVIDGKGQDFFHSFTLMVHNPPAVIVEVPQP